MTAVDERRRETADGKISPILTFLHEAGFPAVLCWKVGQVTDQREALRSLTDVKSLMEALRKLGKHRPNLMSLADEIDRVIKDACAEYPTDDLRKVAHAILAGLADDPPCTAEIFSTVFTHPGEVMEVVRALCQSPDHVLAGVRLRDCWHPRR